MADFTGIITKEFKPKIQSLADDIKSRRDPDFFWPTGTQVYVGKQGSGKTISAVRHVEKFTIRYPRAILVSNLHLKWKTPRTISLTPQQQEQAQARSPRAADLAQARRLAENLEKVLSTFDPATEYVLFSSVSELMAVLTGVNNGFYGVIYLIDEIHTYFNALDSKNVPMEAFAEISQQRKQRKCIIGTSQLFLRMAKPLREQCDNMIVCNTVGGVLTFQTAYDGMDLEQDYGGQLMGTVRKRGWFFHTRHIRGLFDTYQKIVSTSTDFEQPIRIVQTAEKKSIFGVTRSHAR